MKEKNKKTSYEILFTDIDGTFFSHEGGYSRASIERMQALAAMDKHVVIASGRGADSVTDILKHTLKINDPRGCSICLNGALIIENEGKKPLFTAPVPMFAVKTVFDACHKAGLSCHTYSEDYVYFDFESENINYFHQIAKSKVKVVDHIEREMEGRPLKIIANGIYNRLSERERQETHEKLLKVKEIVEPLVEKELNIEFSSIVCLEFTSKKASKGKGVEFLSKHFGIPINQTIAIGDGENDLSMIKCAGLGIATANALDRVKAEADVITKCTCEEGAVGEVIEKYFLGK